MVVRYDIRNFIISYCVTCFTRKRRRNATGLMLLISSYFIIDNKRVPSKTAFIGGFLLFPTKRISNQCLAYIYYITQSNNCYPSFIA